MAERKATKKKKAVIGAPRPSFESTRPVGAVLKELREANGISKASVAGLAEIDPATLHNVEAGVAATFVLVARIAKALGVSLDEIADRVFGGRARVRGASDVRGYEALRRIAEAAAEITEAMRDIDEGRPFPPRRARRRS